MLAGNGNTAGRLGSRSCRDNSDGQGQQAGRLLVNLDAIAGIDQWPAIRVRASTIAKMVKRPFSWAISIASLAKARGMPFWLRAFWTSSASLPSVVSMACWTALTKPSRRWSRFWTNDSMAWRISLKASWTFAVCFRENSMTSVASHTMWFAQTAWNQKVSMPTLRQPTSEFQTNMPGAKASPPISVQPAGSMRKQNMSCSPPYRPVAPLKPFGGGSKPTANSWITASRSALNSRV